MGDVIQLFLLFILFVILIPFLIYIGYCIRFYRIHLYFLYAPQFELEVKSKDRTIEHEDVFYRTADGKTISAWYVPYVPPPPVEDNETQAESTDEEPSHDVPGSMDSKGIILFCHGNAGNISQRIDSFRIFRQLGFSTFIFDYRGYGKSEGIPTEKGTYLDADGAWDYMVKKMKIPPEEIIVFGRSLGGGIASYLAQKYHPRALIIDSSFTSVADMASRLFPGLPLKLLLRFKYNTRKRLKNIHCPVLIIHSPDDRTIPFFHGQILYETANPPKKFLRIKGDHLYNFIQSKDIYIEGLRQFFDELPNPFLSPEAVEDISTY